MTDIIYTGSSLYDMIDAKESIRAYFISKESPELIERHLNAFEEELNKKLELLRDSPQLYTIRKNGVFQNTRKDFRVFTVHWFTVFYVYENERIYIWHIRSQRSDYRELL